jgi:Prokaryotic N-terminal methylation motif
LHWSNSGARFVFGLFYARSTGHAARERGFSLVEALVAMALLGGALTVLASLFAMTARANVEARRVTMASLLARDRLEQLRAPLTVLNASPLDALDRNCIGFADFLDRFGRPVGEGVLMPDSAVYIRRWAVRPAGVAAGAPVILEVVVAERRAAGSLPADMSRYSGAVRLTTVTRRGG